MEPGQTKDPIWNMVGPTKQHSIRWLARRTGYGYQHIWNVRDGRSRATSRFRAACSLALGLPEDVLFLSDCEPAIAS